MGQVRKIKAGLVKISVNDFVGEDGNIFFDIDDGVMRLSDGTTPGGVPLSSASAEGGASTFRQLLDTPSSFADSANKFVKVNPQASALEFVDVDLFDGDYNSLSNLPVLNTFDPSAVNQSIVPDTNITYDLGTPTNRWRDIYLSGNTIHLGDIMIRNVDGAVDLPPNSKVHGRKIAQDISDLTDTTNLLSSGGVTSYNDLTNLPTLFSGSYTDLTNTPTIPTDLSELTDSTNLLAGVGDGGSYALPVATNNRLGGIKIGTGLSINGSGVVSVTASGVTSYNDLTDTPTIPADVSELTDTTNLLGHFSGAYADLTGLPTLVTSYNDLTGLPTLFSGAYADLTGLPTLVTSYNDLTDTPTIPVVPIIISAFTNDSGYITNYTVTQADVTTHQAALSVTERQISDLQSYLTTVAFSDLTEKPTTISAYGITDAYTITQVDSAIVAAVNEILGDAPALLDTLGEIADAVGDDANFVTTINNAISLKANSTDLAVIATTGSYTDLANTPAIPTDISELTDSTNRLASNITEDDLFTYSLIF